MLGEHTRNDVKLQLSRDEMQAYVIVFPPNNEEAQVTEEDILQLLKDNGVVYGVLSSGVKEALRSDRMGYPCLVAQGKPPQNGKDGYIDYKFPTVRNMFWDLPEDSGKVDFRQLNLINNVRKGQLLAVRIPPTSGEPGITVTGKPVPPKPGKPAPIPKGKNTDTDSQGEMLFAATDGHVTIIDNKVHVTPIYEVAGDVDYSTGNIDFVGSVVVKGNITTGFTVKAEGDIEVKGIIEGALVWAGGNITVNNGIAGGDKALVVAGGDVAARFIEGAKVEARGCVLVGDSILQSRVRAGVAVRVDSGKGVIVGGLIQAEEEISAKVVGTPLGVATTLEVGVNPTIREEYRELYCQYQEKKKVLDQIETNINAYRNLGFSLDRLSESKKLMLLKLLDSHRQISEEVNKLKGLLDELEEKISGLQKGKVLVSGTVYPGVTIVIGQAVYTVNDQIKFAMFVCENGEVRFKALK